jgi:membrane protein
VIQFGIGQYADVTTTQEPRPAPTELPAKGWFAALKRVGPRLKELNIPLLASGVAFWAMLSIFPAMLALIAVYGLVADPNQVAQQVGNALGSISSSAKTEIVGQLQQIAASKQQSGIGLVSSLVVLLWSASSGTQNLMQALTTGYEQKETRGFIKLRATALALTLAGLIFAVIVIAAVGVVPPLVDRFVGSGPLKVLALVAEAIVLFVLVVTVLTGLYRFAPANKPSGLRWASPGAVLGALLWTVGTVAFAFYIQNFSSYANTYGALAGVVIFMLWLYLSSYVVLLGALINAEAERGMKGDAASEPEGVDRDVVRGPDEERQEAELRKPTRETVDLRDPSERGEGASHRR